MISYARQILEQTALLEERYKSKNTNRELFSVSSQHYAFVVNAFVSLLEGTDMSRYELFLRETRTYEIIDDVKNFRSVLGLYFCSYNVPLKEPFVLKFGEHKKETQRHP